MKFTKISMLGYSLGGVWLRYAIGVMVEKNMLKIPGLSDGPLEPVLYITFATPHVGTVFMGKGTRVNILNGIGRTMIGQSGRDLFLQGSGNPEDPRPVIEQLADPKSVFFKALAGFKRRILYANAINDRTVPFYTAYLITKDPFKVLHHVHIVHHPHPVEDSDSDSDSASGSTALDKKPIVRKRRHIPPEIDITKSRYIGEHPDESSTDLNIEKQPFLTAFQVRFLIALLTVGPVVVPLIFLVSGVSSIRSNIRVRGFDFKSITDVSASQHSTKPKRERCRDSISAGVAQLTGATVDDLLGPIDDGGEDEEPDFESTLNSATATLKGGDSASSGNLLFSADVPDLDLAPNVVSMINNLNMLSWEKHVVKMILEHSHAEIVDRRHTKGQGEQFIQAWAKTMPKVLG